MHSFILHAAVVPHGSCVSLNSGGWEDARMSCSSSNLSLFRTRHGSDSSRYPYTDPSAVSTVTRAAAPHLRACVGCVGLHGLEPLLMLESRHGNELYV